VRCDAQYETQKDLGQEKEGEYESLGALFASVYGDSTQIDQQCEPQSAAGTWGKRSG